MPEFDILGELETLRWCAGGFLGRQKKRRRNACIEVGRVER